MEVDYGECIIVDLPGRGRRMRGKSLSAEQLLISRAALGSQQAICKAKFRQFVTWTFMKYHFATRGVFTVFGVHTAYAMYHYFRATNIPRKVFPFNEIYSDYVITWDNELLNST